MYYLCGAYVANATKNILKLSKKTDIPKVWEEISKSDFTYFNNMTAWKRYKITTMKLLFKKYVKYGMVLCLEWLSECNNPIQVFHRNMYGIMNMLLDLIVFTNKTLSLIYKPIFKTIHLLKTPINSMVSSVFINKLCCIGQTHQFVSRPVSISS